MDNRTAPWPEDLFGFAYFPDMDDRLRELSEMGEPEDWSYQHTESDHCFPILFNYIRYTYRRLAEEHKIALSEDGQFSCFNTGLVTPYQEAVYASFETHRYKDAQPWYFKGWVRKGEWQLNRFPNLPDLAHYFDDPACLVFDARKELRVNVEHIIAETAEDRFSEPYKSMDRYALQTLVKGAIENAKERVRRSYKTAVPQYYNGRVQLLLPLCLRDAERADLALVVERHDTFYRAATCLTLEMAYNNARQLARPDRDWLRP